MPYKYACFISYRHQGSYMTNFVKRFFQNLSDALDLELADQEKVYLDEDRLQVGNIVDAKIAEAIKQSCCMIVIRPNPDEAWMEVTETILPTRKRNYIKASKYSEGLNLNAVRLCSHI
ncbi:MAG: hypothetical protein AAF599_04480 [Bacteroidota bacterium]